MYDKENFKNYVGGNSGASYIAGLKKIEEECKVSIDQEYNKDRCKSLIRIVEDKKQAAGIISPEREYWSDRCSHLRKYVGFKDLMDNSNKEAFSKWIAKQPKKSDASSIYSPLSCSAFVRALEKGLVSSAGFAYKKANFFFINDVIEVNHRSEKYKTFIQQYDTKNRNLDFKNAIEFYVKFLNEKNGKNVIEKENASLKLKILDLIESYKLNFTKIDKEERYKWEAVKHYKDNWNIDAPDFPNMLEKAFSKTFNLLTAGQYFPLRMLKEISAKHPEEIRKLFKMLYDESLPLANRFDDFRAGFDVFVKERKLNHYQDLHAISVYLTFEYPEKYYIYKYSVWTDFLKNIGEPIPSSKGKHETFKIESSNELCDGILSLVREDIELCSMSASRLDNNCYDDPDYRMLAFDIMFYGSNYKDDEIDGWWPSLEEYNPGLSKENWIEILNDFELTHPAVMSMLKMMLEQGGQSSCAKLAEVYGNVHNYYNKLGSSYGERILKKYNLPVFYDGEVKRYFVIPFVGKEVGENGKTHFAWKLRPELKAALEELDLPSLEVIHMQTDINKNTILYGPPGTGKTYITARYAVAIVENKSLEEIEKLDYEEVLERYNEYKSEGKIEFTTFHQSYGYEEFIEGIKPFVDSEEDGDIRYEIAPGVFKKFCDEANPIVKNNSSDLGLNNSPTVWKVSLCSTGENLVRTDCMQNGHIRIGWDEYGPDITSETDFSKRGGKKVLNSFIYKMRPGDIVVSCYSSTTIDAVGVVTGDYEWHDEYPDYKRLRKVNWLVKGKNINIVDANNGKTFTLATVYRSNISVSDALSIVQKYSDNPNEIETEKQNYVFIIDEINRGNISKIFGELITLIEPTKRVGQEEGLKVRLPYSQTSFGVPDNVYIIGTMNTADRSIAAIDTALRRRFTFKEMMPDTDVINEVIIEGVNVADLLNIINKRIEILYDREHTIGHAYFTSLIYNPSKELLFDIFRNKIFPLLQEYFFEDYEKIQLVLGDNQKTDDSLKFIKENEVDYKGLFGSYSFDYDDKKTYEINDSAFMNIEAYKAMLQGNK